MGQCAELADLGMQMARAVAARALADPAAADVTEPQDPASTARESDTAPQPRPDPAPPAPTLRTPGLRTPSLRTPSLRTPSPTLRIPTCKPIHPALLFIRIAACVRASITLEARLAAEGPALTPRAWPTPRPGPTRHPAPLAPRADPRRAPLHETFHLITEKHPERTALRHEFTTRLEETLAADPAQTTRAPNLFFALCDELGIDTDLATLPDRYLDYLIDPNGPPDPRATSPP